MLKLHEVKIHTFGQFHQFCRSQIGFVCRAMITLHNQKCCPSCHEGILYIPAENVTNAHQPKTEK